nr:MAG TPA: hypothetical protein [Caudoviricetes sp.]
MENRLFRPLVLAGQLLCAGFRMEAGLFHVE